MADPSNPPIAIRAAARSDVGMRRPANQDAIAILPKPNGQPHVGDVFLMVADGMGGHAAGEIASRIAVETIPPAFCKAEGRSAPSALRHAVQAANTRINSKGAECSDHHDMGTTCSCLVLSRGAGLVAHVGDSRVYRLRDGVLEQLTFDHSLVWELAAASDVSEDKVPSYIPKNVITRSLGPKATVQVDIEGPQELRPGDVFLLCSDGLSGVVEDPVIGGVLATLEPDAAAEALVDFANLGGGPDNVSVVVARVEACDSKTPACPTTKSWLHWPWAVVAAVACLAACGWFLVQGEVTGTIASAICLGASIVAALASR
ncbi:MAG: protein phosphatase 2C domain-containing protein, partial [Planctomycetota bacterium]